MSTALATYLDALPQGLDSYPEFRLKGSIFRQFIDALDVETLLPALPTPLQRWVRRPPPDNAWMPEVHSNAIFVVAAQVCFASEAAFVEFAYDANSRALQTPLYHGLIRFLSPQRVVRLAASTWGLMHAGSSLAVHDDGHSVELEMQHPAFAYPRLMLSALATGYAAAAHLAGEEDTVVRLSCSQEGEARFHLDWRGRPLRGQASHAG